MTNRILVCSLVPLFLLGGCYAASTGEDAASIAEALEEENGGLDTSDEAPAFAEQDELAELELLSDDPAMEDDLAADPAVEAMRTAPEAVAYRVAVVWGQVPGDRGNDTLRDWSGILATNRGALLVRRTIAFEPRTDRLLPRSDPRFAPFTSVTLPHFDGVVLHIIDPDPANDEPIGLGYLADLPGPLGSEASEPLGIALRALLDGPVELTRDEAGNRMIAVAQARPIDPCAHGFLMGQWHRVAEGRGRFVGRVVNEDGALTGHMRGIYGVRRSGEQVFFGKYITVDGTFRGIFAGHYADGHFEGRWHTRAGDVGALGGRYRESIEGLETGGEFLGRWGETSCDFPL